MMARKRVMNAIKTEVDGIMFPSKKEANRYCELKLLEKAKVITDLKSEKTHRKDLTFELQPAFVHLISGKKIRAINYWGDFSYIEDGRKVVEEVKGHQTQLFKMKWKMVKYHYPGIDFRII